jgi:hypothetical protein
VRVRVCPRAWLTHAYRLWLLTHAVPACPAPFAARALAPAAARLVAQLGRDVAPQLVSERRHR